MNCANDLYPQELSSLRWLIIQYKLNWNMTATACSDISKGGSGMLTCRDDQNGYQTIINLIVITSTTVDHGEPPVIDKLILPNLETLLFSGIQITNSTYSLLGLLDNNENVNLYTMTFHNAYIISPPTFPSNIKLITLNLFNVTLNSDLNLNQLFVGVNTTLNLEEIVFSSIYTLLSDSSAMTTKSRLSTITIKKIPKQVFLFESSTLRNIDIDNAMIVLGDLPVLFNILATNCEFSTSNFSVFPSLRSINFDNVSTSIEKASGLIYVMLNNTNTAGQLRDYKSFNSATIKLYGLPNIITGLYDSFCRFTLDIQSTLFDGNVSDCFYCYWSEIQSTLPSNTPIPPIDFKCSIYPTSNEYGTTNLTFSTIQNYTLQIYWGLELSVNLIQSENIEGNNVLIKAFGKFNLQAPLAVTATSFGNSNCQITYNTTTQLNYDTISNINIYSSPSISKLGFLINYYTIKNPNVEIIANFGPNPYNVSAIISNFQSQTSFLNDSVLLCILPAGLVENTVYKMVVYANGYHQTVTLFIPPKEDCGSQSKCNEHGSCTDGKCRCVIILPNNTDPSPTIIVKDGMNFTFNIIAIQEIDELSSVVRELKTDKWSYSTTGNETFSITTYSLQSTTSGIDQINATIEYSKNSRLIEFAGQSTLYPENSLKLMITINNWSFKDRLNQLRILMESISSINNNIEDCSELDITKNNGTELNYFRMTINDVSFYVVNQTKDSILIGMTLPYCDSCIIDPDFSVLINTDVQSDCKEKSKFSTWKIATIVVVLSVVLLASSVGVIFFVKKKLNVQLALTQNVLNENELISMRFLAQQTSYNQKNSSYSLLQLLDNVDNVNLTFIQISTLNLDVPSGFPKYIKINNLNLININMLHDISLNALLNSSVVNMLLNNLTSTSTFKVTFDTTATVNQNIQKLEISNVPSFVGPLNITDTYFPKLSDINLDFITYQNIEFHSGSVQTLNVKNCGFKSGDLSSYPIKMLSITNNKTPLLKTKDVDTLTVVNSSVPILPDRSWVSERAYFSLRDTNTTGHLDNPIAKNYLWITGTQNVTTTINDSFCQVSDLNIFNAQLLDSHIPECFYCFWYHAFSMVPSNSPPPPPNFNCNISLEKNGFYVNTTENMYIKGKNLGWGRDSNVSVVISNELFLKRFLPSLSGKTTISFSTVKPYDFDIFWGPQLQVNYIHEETYDSNSKLLLLYGVFNMYAPISVTIQDTPCQITYNTTSQLNCVIPINTLSGRSLVNTYDTVSIVGLYISQPLIISNILFNDRIFINANFGPNPYNVSVYISDFNCTISSINSNQLSCTPTQSITSSSYMVLLYANGFSSSAELLINKTDCGSDNQCNGNGSCTNGKCRCNDGYGGYFCQSPLSPGVIILPNNTIPSPTVIVKDGMNFTFNIIAIQEIDELSSVVRELKTDKWSYSTTGNETFSITTYSLQTSTGGIDQINATIEYSKNSRLIEFAGQSTLYPENSLKLMITINNWSFKDRLNQLRILMESKATIDLECSELGIKADNESNVNFIQMTNGDRSFYGRFLPYALSDNRPVLVQNQVVNQTKDSILIGMTLPYCDSCIIDPDFSVLINTDVQDSCKDNKFATWKIVTIVVVVSVVSIAVAASAFIIIRKKLIYKKENNKLANKLNKF
ncbi:Tenascin [Heterostelium album PN500]|uniref:Tenascin n=1 Tax=Heterostelium pallidum (strain ATCC 26659 / Pp 5 / PN500) TaxID=670386 RepID=D3B9W9_HETP5|nr:Tenascin [Heterostelium album PN500]EFA81356.1 Tenascin [Heterostelium album PN500]|eukprot:XP_020433474.1 Tenascin [Heterostelium album PN500]